LSIEEFPLAWRWTEATYAVLPPEVLASLVPLQPHAVGPLYRRGGEIFPEAAAALVHSALEDPEVTRVWLRALPISSSASVAVVWNSETGISLPWQMFVAYWDDFCYPSSDDAFVFPDSGTSALAWHHWETFQFIENAV
jgi:hypothetical protein